MERARPRHSQTPGWAWCSFHCPKQTISGIFRRFSVIGRKSYLLPVQDSDTEWYKNVLSNQSIRINARGAQPRDLSHSPRRQTVGVI